MNFPETFYTVDVLFGIFVVLFAVSGLLRGGADEVARLLTLIILLTVFGRCYPYLAQATVRGLDMISHKAAYVLAGVVLLAIGILLFIGLKMLLVLWFDHVVGCLFWDRTIGAVAGLLIGTLLGLSVLCSMSLFGSTRLYSVLSERSLIGRWVCGSLTPKVYPSLLKLPAFSNGELEVPAE